MPVNGTDYTKYIQNAHTPFYFHLSNNDMKSSNIKIFNVQLNDKENWSERLDNDWHYVMYHNLNELPNQGWKIHISANIADADKVLEAVSLYLITKKVSFKFVPNEYDLKLMYSKNADRIEAGKFITIYPRNDSEFCELLDPLMELTKKFKEGPYIFNDCPWKQSNVYFRYGGFRRMITLKNDVPVYSIQTPDGEFIEDKRVPYYITPDFVEELKFITDNNTFPNKEEFSDLNSMQINGAIHYSNSGGVYEGTYKGQPVIIKEGRPNVGLDQNGNDGVTLVRHESEMLKKLSKINGVVNQIGYKEIWKHNYLIEEKISGQTLSDYMALKYPFSNNFSVKSYTKMAIQIIDQLITILNQVHSENTAIVDFKPDNIILNINKGIVKVTVLDFESSEEIDKAYKPNLITQDFVAFQSKTFEDGDWFVLYRIARNLFLPVETTMFFSKKLEERQNKNIEKKFGCKVVDYLVKVRKICEQHTRIYRNSAFYEGEIDAPKTCISRQNIERNIEEIKNGIINNFNYDSDNLSQGDINQYREPLNCYAINNGAMGCIMALNRVDNLILENEKIKTWLNQAKINIQKIIKSQQDFDIGLFSGLSGIALTFYDLGEEKFAKELLESCNIKNKNLDISIYSGVSGVGMTNLALYASTGDNKYKHNILDIVDCIVKRYENENFEEIEEYEGKLSLLKGWGGAVLFLWKSGILLDIKILKDKAIEILNSIVDSGIVEEEQGLSLSDRSRGILRMLPYLDTGFAGISLLILEIKKDDSEAITAQYQDIIKYLESDPGTFCTYQDCLFSGVAGMIVQSNAIKNNFKKDNSLDVFVNSLNNYAVSVKNNELIFPGVFGVKCSMDYETGAAGILLSLIDLKRGYKSWYSWFPLLTSNKLNLFNNIKSQKLN